MKTKLVFALCFIILHSSFILSAHAQGTAFTYQGRLNDGANVANGTYDLRFAIFDAPSAGTRQGNLITNSATAVSNGLFTVTLDFGSQFPGAARWLEIAVRTNGAANLFTLSPRQALTPTPYAITAGNVVSGGLAGTYGNQLIFNNAANQVTGAFTGNGANVTNVNAVSLQGLDKTNLWQLGGNNVAPGQFLGSLTTQPLVIRANNLQVMQFAYASNAASGYSPNVIGGNSANSVSAGVVGATIGGGGVPGLFGPNSVSADFGTVVGGSGCSAQGLNAVAGGNTSVASGNYSVAMGEVAIASGINATAFGYLSKATNKYATAAGYQSIAGGQGSTAMGYASSATGDFSTALGQSTAANTYATALGLSSASAFGATAVGAQSTASGSYSTALGGSTASAFGATSTGGSVAGGIDSTALGGSTANGDYSTAMGSNSLASYPCSTAMGGATTASGPYATAMGFGSVASGMGSTAMGFDSLANSYLATAMGAGKALNVGATAMGGAQSSGIYSTAMGGANAGGTYSTAMGTSQAYGNYSTALGNANTIGNYSTALGVAGTRGDYSFAGGNRAYANDYGSFIWCDGLNQDGQSQGTNSFTVRASGGYYLYSSGGASGVFLFPGAVAWSAISDLHAKKNFQPVNCQAVLDKLANVPISQWNYKWEADTSTPNLGPMAQDFKAAFYPGRDDKSISTLEFDGVELAAIQGLNQKVDELNAVLNRRNAENAELKQRLEALEKIILNHKSN